MFRPARETRKFAAIEQLLPSAATLEQFQATNLKPGMKCTKKLDRIRSKDLRPGIVGAGRNCGYGNGRGH
jgi:hypothetical protein